MNISHDIVLDGDSAIIEIDGAIERSTAHLCESYINQLLENNVINLVIDTTKLDYLSSEGIGLLLFINRKVLVSNGCLVLCCLGDEIKTLFSVLGFDRLLVIAKDRDEAFSILQDREHFFDEKRSQAVRHVDEITMMHTREEGENGNSIGPAIEEDLETVPDNQDHESDAHKSTHVDQPNVFEAIIVECVDCKSLIRVETSGEHICPNCERGFKVFEEQTVVF